MSDLTSTATEVSPASGVKRVAGAFLDRDCLRDTLAGQLACLADVNARGAARHMTMGAPREVQLDAAARLPGDSPVTSITEQQYYEYFLALEATLLVQNAIHTGRYAYRSHRQDLASRPLGMDSEANLYEGIGLCGTAVEAIIALLSELGVKSRRVHMFYIDVHGTRQSHIAAEAFLCGKWVFLEPTWGLVFQSDAVDARSLELLSWLELRHARGAFRTIDNRLNSWRAMADLIAEPFDYAKLDAVEATVGEIGDVTVPLVSQDGRLVASFDGIHNFVGYGRADQGGEGVKLLLPLPASGSYRVTVHVANRACAQGTILMSGKEMEAVDDSTFTAEVTGPAVLSVGSPDDVCYFVLSAIEATPLPAAETMCLEP